MSRRPTAAERRATWGTAVMPALTDLEKAQTIIVTLTAELERLCLILAKVDTWTTQPIYASDDWAERAIKAISRLIDKEATNATD